MPLLSRFVLVACLVAPLAGCAGGRAVPEEGPRWSEGNVRDHLQELAAPVAADSASAARRALYAARRMRAARLMPAREPSFLLRMGGTDLPASSEMLADPAQAHVLGYVAGRHPSHYDELVLVAADLDSPGAAAALEVAQALAMEARYTQTPERTVLFALWSPPRTGARGLADFLANPTWALPQVTRALLVTADSTAAAESRRLLEARGIPADVVAVSDQSVTGPSPGGGVERARTLARTLRLTDALYAQTVIAATDHDSTAVRP